MCDAYDSEPAYNFSAPLQPEVGMPLGSKKFREAAIRRQWSWMPTLQLGGYGNDWPPDTFTLKVREWRRHSVAVILTKDDHIIQGRI